MIKPDRTPPIAHKEPKKADMGASSGFERGPEFTRTNPHAALSKPRPATLAATAIREVATTGRAMQIKIVGELMEIHVSPAEQVSVVSAGKTDDLGRTIHEFPDGSVSPAPVYFTDKAG